MSTELYCGHCGGALSAGGEGPTSDAHPGRQTHLSCLALRAMEPPRYCAQCRRRMKVQVTPLGWSAECSRHGSLAG